MKAPRPDRREIRIVRDRKDVEAERLVNAHFTCQGKGSGHASGVNLPSGCCQTLDDVQLKFGALADGSKLHEPRHKLIASLVEPGAGPRKPTTTCPAGWPNED